MQRVSRYGVPWQIATGQVGEHGGRVVRPWDIPSVVPDQLRLARQLANDLVAVELAYDQMVDDAWRGASPEIAAAMADLAAAEQVLAEAREQARKARSARRSVAVDEATAAAVRTAVSARREAWQRIKAARTREARAAAKPALSAADAWRKARFTEFYPDYCRTGVPPQYCRQCWAQEATVDRRTGACSACGHTWPPARLYWATFNKVLEQHQIAAKRVRAARSEGRWARFRFHPFDGTGRIAVQLQREHGPDCRCAKCVQREMDAWRVREVDGKIVVSRRATARPRRPEVPETVVESVAAAAAMLAEAARVPAAAVGLAAGGEVTPPDGPAYVSWLPAVDERALLELPGPKDPPRSPQLLASGGGKWRNVLQLTLPSVPGGYLSPREFEEALRRRRAASVPLMLPSPKIDPAGRRAMLARVDREWQRLTEGVARMRIGDELVTLPVVIHRPLPPEADVTEAQLVVRRIADQLEMYLCVTAELPEPPPPADGPVVAMHLGWRLRPDGSVRVATWAASEPVEVPALTAALGPGESVQVVHTIDSGRVGEVIVPAGWLDRAANPHRVRSARDTAFSEIREWLADWLDQRDLVLPAHQRQPELSAWLLRRWRSVDRFASLAGRLVANPPDLPGFAAEVVPRLREWLDGTRGTPGDRHLRRYAAHEAHQLAGRRDDLWRRVAAWLAGLAAEVRVDDVDVVALRRRPGEATTDDDLVVLGTVLDKIRARAHIVAPGALREALKGAASTRGVPVVTVAVAGLGRTCPHCGYVAKAKDARWAASAVVTCPGCAASYDQDVVTARAMLRATVANA